MAAPAQPTAPRSRSARTADSRLLILDAAVACLVEDGYAGASTLAVQARAGVSRGRLLHHFPSRAELLVAAADHLATTKLDEVRRRSVALMADGPTGRERVDRAIDLMWATFQEPPFWAATELWTAARTDPALRAALRRQWKPLWGVRLLLQPLGRLFLPLQPLVRLRLLPLRPRGRPEPLLGPARRRQLEYLYLVRALARHSLSAFHM